VDERKNQNGMEHEKIRFAVLIATCIRVLGCEENRSTGNE
jgi:hypothetical protein